ncbi:bifunctional non-homologous end joining protein LigD [Nocardiopsis arvandica]|uniref:Bifunctional non-homologous end joining protein LigD n=1 Tax=Nocardiopsis sinuspersici TaxID=501010 RepID=A0A7Y9XDA3_9ACTN|nr:non-homologous end-joining DNA ligase [Nocardiopsis sinuspersici]NYH53709.1 bifunctional non-homologous end joining protein LigD [Nocardiopsis sinuspersici]
MATGSAKIRAGRRVVRVRRPDKPLFGENGATKEDLAEYHARIAPLMLPHVRDRPVALERFPDGVGAQGFFVKHPSVPDWVRTVETSGGRMMVCQDAAALVWCADQAAITVHAWQSREPNLGRPDRLVIDLDPAGDGPEAFDVCRAAARDTREVLDDLGLAAYVMTSGSRGLHVRSPLRPEVDDQGVRRLAEAVAGRIAARRPDELTTEVRKAARGDRLFVDYLRNGLEQLAVAPYSVRARPGAPVAAPITWEELDGLESARAFTIGLERDGCPFAGMGRHARSPRRALERLG